MTMTKTFQLNYIARTLNAKSHDIFKHTNVVIKFTFDHKFIFPYASYEGRWYIVCVYLIVDFLTLKESVTKFVITSNMKIIYGNCNWN